MPKSISLTRGLEALVDDEDFPTLNARKWHAQVDRKGYVYAAHRLPTGEMLLMHRVLTGCLPGELADHANGNTLDNRRVNLRKCSHSENNRNKIRKRRATGSRFKGVRRSTHGKRWRASICVGNRRVISLGGFPTEESAARAYDIAALKYFGEFARLNFPNGLGSVGALLSANDGSRNEPLDNSADVNGVVHVRNVDVEIPECPSRKHPEEFSA